MRDGKKIHWRRAKDGFVESRNGRWQITPLYWGCTRPQVYQLTRDGKVVANYCAAQREAKDLAEEVRR